MVSLQEVSRAVKDIHATLGGGTIVKVTFGLDGSADGFAIVLLRNHKSCRMPVKLLVDGQSAYVRFRHQTRRVR